MKKLNISLILILTIAIPSFAFDFGSIFKPEKEVKKTVQQEQTLTNENKQQLELLVIVKTEKSQYDEPLYVKNIDGKLSLNRKNGIVKFNNCFTNDIKDTYNSASRELYEMLPQNHDVLAINTMYKNYGLPNISSVASEKVEELLKGSKLEISSKCNDNTITDLSYTSANTSDITIIPRYLLPYVLKTNDFASMQNHDLLGVVSYDEIKKTSESISKKEQDRQEKELQIGKNYIMLANSKSKESIGSLVISLNDYGDKKQTVCTESYVDEDAQNVIGYRNQKSNFLIDSVKDVFVNNKLSLDVNRNLFDQTFKDLNSAYLKIKEDKNACNIYVDYPYNIELLKNALARDGVPSFYGKLFKATDMQEKYVISYGYESKKEYDFGTKYKASLEQIKFLRKYAANIEDTYIKYRNEMVESKYSDKKDDVATVSWYIYDKANGEKKKISAVSEKNARILAEKKAADEAVARNKKANEEFAKNNPYEAILSCEFSGNHTNLAACFSGGQYGADTELELTNGSQYGMYKAYQLYQLGQETTQGLVLSLKKNFNIKAQNSSSNLLLSLVIKERSSGRIIYQKSASKYGLVYFAK